ncbi:hypothetical protein QE152_g37893 [Popillia japonica]|uniref:Maturase K n=1 Tax=Popillia japonica TaxID=7064 RepID=A0AAW1I9F2_POPJA
MGVGESSSDNSGEILDNVRKTYYYGKNRNKWSKVPPATSSIPSSNIISHLPEPIGEDRTKNPKIPMGTLDLLLDDILSTILERTNYYY